MYRFMLAILFLMVFAGMTFSAASLFHNIANGQEPMKQYSLLIFSATWCGPCQNMHRNVWPVLEKDGSLEHLDVHYVDVDENPQFTRQWKVSSMPTVVLARNNPDGTASEINRFVGMRSANSVRDWINKLIQK